MKWIHITHLLELAKLSGPAAPLSLYVWTQSGSAPHDETRQRYPVELGDAEHQAELLGVSARTIRRHSDRIRSSLVETRPGWFTPSLQWANPWKTGPKTKDDKPLYIRMTDKAVRALIGLSKQAPAQTAGAAFRIACSLLIEMRWAQFKGKDYATAHNGRRYGSRYPSPLDSIAETDKTIAKAFALLEKSGLIKTEPGTGRRVSTTRGLLAHIPDANDWGEPVDNPAEHRADIADKLPTPNSFGIIKQEHRKPSRACAREVSPNGMDVSMKELEKISKTIADCIPGMDLQGARHLAPYCKTPEEAQQWAADELPHLMERDNPAGAFIAMARKGITRPGAPSGWGAQRKREDGILPNRSEHDAATPEEYLQRMDARNLQDQKARKKRDLESAELFAEIDDEIARRLNAGDSELLALEIAMGTLKETAAKQGEYYVGPYPATYQIKRLMPRLESARKAEAARKASANKARIKELRETIKRSKR